MTHGDATKLYVFLGLLEDKALSWYLVTRLKSWSELEQEFNQMWCIVMTATNAILEVAKIFQKERNTFGCIPLSLKGIKGLYRDLVRGLNQSNVFGQCLKGVLGA